MNIRKEKFESFWKKNNHVVKKCVPNQFYLWWNGSKELKLQYYNELSYQHFLSQTWIIDFFRFAEKQRNQALKTSVLMKPACKEFMC